MEMKCFQIMNRHKLRYEVANYLANVAESDDWKEYENHKVNLQKSV